MEHLQAYRAAGDGKHRANKPIEACARSRRLLIAAAVLFAAGIVTSESKAQSGPFAPMAGSWSGGGTVSGLPGGQSVVLLNNGRDSLSVAANGRFVFGGLVPFNGSYLVTISSQPASANCVVTNASGTANGDVNNVLVTCQPR